MLFKRPLISLIDFLSFFNTNSFIPFESCYVIFFYYCCPKFKHIHLPQLNLYFEFFYRKLNYFGCSIYLF
jgi:hypothetical protein